MAYNDNRDVTLDFSNTIMVWFVCIVKQWLTLDFLLEGSFFGE